MHLIFKSVHNNKTMHSSSSVVLYQGGSAPEEICGNDWGHYWSSHEKEYFRNLVSTEKG